jgi:NitT/TauT family transport system ATP-binding protein
MTDTFHPLCEVIHVDHSFVTPGGKELKVLEDVSLEVQRGEVVCLLGPSGCGKSTLMRVLAGLIKPKSGSVHYNGALLEGMNRNISIVFQSFALFPWMTVQENVEVVLAARGVAKAEIKPRTERAITTVGLAGFEEAYPRELSGGMKQRAGMARALSVEPEILMMDEPFSQVDALTAESLRAEILDIWARHEQNISTIMMVSHDIKEVVYMADRIVLMSANPGRISRVVHNPLPRPRDYRSQGFLRMVDYLHDIITGAELPDEQPAEAAPWVFEALPHVSSNEIVGLLEYLDSHGGQGDVFQIANELNREFGTFIAVVKAAEMLDFVDTPRRGIVFTPFGRKFVEAGIDERQALWRNKLLELVLVRHVYDMVRNAPGQRLKKDIVLEEIALRLPQEDWDTTFETLVAWSRFANLLAYDDDTDMLEVQ